MPGPPCPAPDELAAFAAGQLPTATFERVADHVQGCAECQGRLDTLDRQDNSVLAALRQAPAEPVPLTAPWLVAAPDGDTPPHVPTTQFSPAPVAARGGPWVFGSGPRLESEIRDLLQFRLRVMSVVTLIVFGFFVLEHVTQTFGNSVTPREWDWGDHGVLVGSVFAQAAGAAIVWRRKPVALRRLRVAEVLMGGSVTVSLACTRYVMLAAAGQLGAPGLTGPTADPDVQRLHVEHALLLSNMAWFFNIAFYGLFIPNTWRRAAVTLVVLGVIPVAILPLAARVNPAVADRLPMLVGATSAGMLLTVALAAFGSFKISTLQREAFVARQEARELGQYQLTRKLGGGGMGEVYLAEHRLLKRACAVKLIRPQSAGDPDYLRRFEREVKATAQLNHPNTVEVYDYGHAEDGTFYYVMEYLDGLTLDDLVSRHGPLPPARAVHVLRQLCGALRAAHGAGLVHRDIKPGNIMIGPDGTPRDRVKLLDFGLVRPAAAGASKLTQEGIAVGTPEYMSPEQVEGDAALDGRSDLYSLGAVAYFLLAGRPPFTGDNSLKVLLAHLHATAPPLRTLRADVPTDLEAVVHRCLAKTASTRFADAASLDLALADCACADEWTEAQAADWWRAAAAGPGVR
jgi:serine/threonine-protein kinase